MFEVIGRAFERYLDPEAAKYRADFMAQQTELREFVSTLYRVLHENAYSCFNALVYGNMPNHSKRVRILLSTDWTPYYYADPPLTKLDGARANFFKFEDDPLKPRKTKDGFDYPKYFFELKLTRNQYRGIWELNERNPKEDDEYPHGREIQNDPEYVNKWIECAKTWRK